MDRIFAKFALLDLPGKPSVSIYREGSGYDSIYMEESWLEIYGEIESYREG